MSAKRLRAWSATASPGDAYTYHTGRSLADADPGVVAETRKLYDEGLIELCQRRHARSFEYLAQKRTTRAKRAPVFGGKRRAK